MLMIYGRCWQLFPNNYFPELWSAFWGFVNIKKGIHTVMENSFIFLFSGIPSCSCGGNQPALLLKEILEIHGRKLGPDCWWDLLKIQVLQKRTESDNQVLGLLISCPTTSLSFPEFSVPWLCLMVWSDPLSLRSDNGNYRPWCLQIRSKNFRIAWTQWPLFGYSGAARQDRRAAWPERA